MIVTVVSPRTLTSSLLLLLLLLQLLLLHVLCAGGGLGGRIECVVDWGLVYLYSFSSH